MSSTSFWRCPSSTKNHLKKKGAISDIVEKEWVLHVLRLILGGEDFLIGLIEVASVHSCPIWSMWDTFVLDISWIPLWIDGRSDPPVPTFPFRCTSARSNQFWVAIHHVLGLEENDREFLRNVLPGRQLFCDISSTRWRRYGTVSVLQFYRAEHHGIAPSWLRSAGQREHPVLICLKKIVAGFAFNQEVSRGAIDHSLIPTEKTLRTLHFWNCFAELK